MAENMRDVFQVEVDKPNQPESSLLQNWIRSMLHTKAVKISSRSDLGITTDEPQGCGVVTVQSVKTPVTTQNIWYKASLRTPPAVNVCISGTLLVCQESEF